MVLALIRMYIWLQTYVKESKFNLILGLTASPGSDKEKIKEVCDNLYVGKYVSGNSRIINGEALL